jgi:replicative superfamily II helicase
MHTNVNRTGKSGPPRRYKHQQELMEIVSAHLTEVANAPEQTLPLHVILATPTGSGKTFTAVMMHLYLLKKEHPDAVLLYSVPTKQVRNSL